MGDEWRPAYYVLETVPAEQSAPLGSAFEMLAALNRLRAWAAHGVLEQEFVENDDPWEEYRFRATTRSRALLEQGLNDVEDAPQLYVGGCLVNDPASPWVRVDDDAGWRLVQG